MGPFLAFLYMALYREIYSDLIFIIYFSLFEKLKNSHSDNSSFARIINVGMFNHKLIISNYE